MGIIIWLHWVVKIKRINIVYEKAYNRVWHMASAQSLCAGAVITPEKGPSLTGSHSLPTG